jgi:hypothetical protein
MRNVAILLIAITLVGCSGSNRNDKVANRKPEGDIEIPESLIGRPSSNASEVLIEVNGKKLTLAEAMSRMNEILGPPPANMPDDRTKIIQNRVLSKIVDEFVAKMLLLCEAERRSISISEEEQQEALEKIRGQLPDGVTLEEFYGTEANREQMLSAMTEGIKVQKLLGQLREENPAAPVTEEDIDAYIKALDLKEVDRDEIRKTIEGRRSKEHLKAIITELQAKAEIKYAPAVTPPVHEE